MCIMICVLGINQHISRKMHMRDDSNSSVIIIIGIITIIMFYVNN